MVTFQWLLSGSLSEICTVQEFTNYFANRQTKEWTQCLEYPPIFHAGSRFIMIDLDNCWSNKTTAVMWMMFLENIFLFEEGLWFQNRGDLKKGAGETGV